MGVAQQTPTVGDTTAGAPPGGRGTSARPAQQLKTLPRLGACTDGQKRRSAIHPRKARLTDTLPSSASSGPWRVPGLPFTRSKRWQHETPP